MPFDEELVFNDAVIIENIADSCGEFLLFGVLVDEELNESLEEVLDAVFLVTRDEISEYWLVLSPSFDDVAVWSENGDHAEVELVLRSDVELELHLAYLLEDSSQIARVVGTSSGFFSFFFSNKSFQFFTCVCYRKNCGQYIEQNI